ncbi:uncharacterized protein PAC_02130 [Phialocephala subalpina]|uniref:Uncharacterized protein n=1 Tax=Phialocephala subalpina TaxID=576137 RepID=A0A1L7WHK7_9HELO|nr:uncharacterized protein PAC_02130 [Phialocephala subalpina]
MRASAQRTAIPSPYLLIWKSGRTSQLSHDEKIPFSKASTSCWTNCMSNAAMGEIWLAEWESERLDHAIEVYFPIRWTGHHFDPTTAPVLADQDLTSSSWSFSGIAPLGSLERKIFSEIPRYSTEFFSSTQISGNCSIDSKVAAVSTR